MPIQLDLSRSAALGNAIANINVGDTIFVDGQTGVVTALNQKDAAPIVVYECDGEENWGYADDAQLVARKGSQSAS
ncbi:hypothetical protein [Burkholderia sp. Ac-20365]|uniref:hypothetical protein n=1 Tax=Burkholderia sp. Ac-20365 TaxID=2703897 RepID=UPI00197B3488|nr:hypothetical protein [Burkholderia sp. Ac-20365]MBN3760874.1 hypothetical protein [Burkholderia sp. Ac-20365]